MKQLSIFGIMAALSLPVLAQQPQIPTLQVCNLASGMVVSGGGTVDIPSRKDATHTGTFGLQVEVNCNTNGFPAGALTLTGISMTDSAVQGTIQATTFEQLTSTGTATPTAWMNGRCEIPNAAGAAPAPCKYWIMFVHNNTIPSAANVPDIVSFLVFNQAGKRIAYGTGPVSQGIITVSPTPW